MPQLDEHRIERRPLLSASPFFVGLRYLLRKKLSYLAIVGVALSVGVLIVVMSVFSGFYLEMTATIRGYLSDLTVKPREGGMYALDDWESWRESLLEIEGVEGVSPFLEGAALARNPSTGRMFHVLFRGIHPGLEQTVSELPDYMVRGSVADLGRTHPNPEGGRLRSCFVGNEFFGRGTGDITQLPDLVLVTVTPALERALAKYRVNGIFKTGHYKYDNQVVLLSLDTASQLVNARGVSGLSVSLADYDNAQEIKQRILENMAPGASLFEPPSPATALKTVAFSGDGTRLAAATEAGEVVTWNVAERTGPETCQTAGDRPTALALSAGGDRLLVGYADGTAHVLDPATGEEVLGIPAGDGAVTEACFDPYGYYLALAREGGVAELLDAETGESLATLGKPTSEVTEISFGPDGERLLVVRADGVARVWNAEEGRIIHTVREPAPLHITTAAFSPDGKSLATGARDGTLTLWDAETWRPFARWKPRMGAIQKVRFGWTSQVLLASYRGAIMGWRTHGSAPDLYLLGLVGIEAEGGGFRQVVFQSNGERAATLYEDGKLRVQHTGGRFGVETWEENRQVLLKAVKMERFLQALIMSLILVLAEFFIFVIITTMVYEKRRDIGIMNAVGFTRGQICQVFLTCGLAIGVLGAVLGVTGGVLFADNINAIREFIHHMTGWDPFPADVYYFTEIPSHMGVLTPVVTAGGAIVCALLFSIIPALRAARMDPIRTLHHE